MSTLSSDLRTLSREAYLYLYPLVTMEVTRRQSCNVPVGQRPGFGPANRFNHVRQFPGADFRSVVRPNFDTLYSSAWIDLTGGPVQINVPDSGDRYYMLPMLDMWTDVFANPGKRTTGTAAQHLVLVPPGYTGRTPVGTTRIEAPTPHVWVIGRTQTNGPADFEAVHAFQDGLEVVELGSHVEHTIDPALDMDTEPLHTVNAMKADEFFTRAAEALRTVPTHASDWDQLARMSRLGLIPGVEFAAAGFSTAELDELDAGLHDAHQAMAAAPAQLATPFNGWVAYTDTMGVYGNHYLKRALVTLVGLGANPAEDAIYPLLLTDAYGEAVTGETDYVLHFDADRLPPATAFWSVTMYDDEGFQAANELDRYAIGDRDALAYNADGSLDIYIQHENPGPERASNWLPAPRGPLGITMRLYAPEPAALNGTWRPPAVHKSR
jgi:hypothetical protein